MSSFNEAQHSRDRTGKFAARHMAEQHGSLTDEPDGTGGASTPEFRSAGGKGEHPPTIAARLARLKEGDPVRFTKDGRTLDLTVTGEYRRRDGGGFGSSDHAAVTVGYGPGRWNTEVTAARISDGFAELEIPGEGGSR